MNIIKIKIVLYPSPLAPFFGNEEDLKLRCKLEWPYQWLLWKERLVKSLLNQFRQQSCLHSPLNSKGRMIIDKVSSLQLCALH